MYGYDFFTFVYYVDTINCVFLPYLARNNKLKFLCLRCALSKYSTEYMLECGLRGIKIKALDKCLVLQK